MSWAESAQILAAEAKAILQAANQRGGGGEKRIISLRKGKAGAGLKKAQASTKPKASP